MPNMAVAGMKKPPVRAGSARSVRAPRRSMLAVPALLSVLVYANSLTGDFVHDDIAAIVRNPDVTGHRHWARIWTDDFWGEWMGSAKSHKSYRPITTLLFRLCFWASGGSPTAFHAVNVALHAANTWLFALICRSQLAAASEALLAATLFAIHPIHTEAVSGLVGCAELLSCFFSMLSFLASSKSASSSPREDDRQRGTNEGDARNETWHWLSLLLAGVALLCKETGLMVLVVNAGFRLYLERWSQHLMSTKAAAAGTNANAKAGKAHSLLPGWRLRRRLMLDVITFCCLLLFRLVLVPNVLGAAGSSAQRAFTANGRPQTSQDGGLFGASLPSFSPQDNPAAFHQHWDTRTLTLLYLPVFCFAQFLLMPMTLCYDWQMGAVPLVQQISDSRAIFALGFYIMMTTFVARAIKVGAKPGVVLGLLFLVLPFLPASNLGFTVGFVVAERVMYMPSAGFCILVASGLSLLHRGQRPWKKHLLLGLLALTCAAFVARTVTRNADWQSREALFRSGVKSVPGNAKVHYNFANWNKDMGHVEAAQRHYQEAIRLWPLYTLAHNNLAALLNDSLEAERHLHAALDVDPGHPTSLFNLALLLRNRGLCSEAIPLLERCLLVEELQSAGEDAAAGLLSECLDEQKRLNVVGQRHQEAVNDTKVEHFTTQSELIEAYIAMSEWAKAETLLVNSFESMDTASTLALYQLSQVFLNQERLEEALSATRAGRDQCGVCGEITQLTSKDQKCSGICVRVLIQEGDIMQECGRYKQALMRYEAALMHTPDDAELLLSLGTMHHVLGELSEAQEAYMRSKRLHPDHPVLLSNLRLIRWSLVDDRRRTTTEHSLSAKSRCL